MSALVKTPRGDLILVMSLSEARGLLALAGKGARDVLNDLPEALFYIGNRFEQSAARRALETLAVVAK